MKMKIEEIKEAYRKAVDKQAAIKELAASEGTSVEMIKFYVRGINGPDRPIDKPAPMISDAFVPIAPKKLGRPSKNTNAIKPTKKAPAKARPVDKVIPMTKKAPKPVFKAPETVITAPNPAVEVKCEKVIPIAHHCENEGEPPQIKYTCPNGCKGQVYQWHKTCHYCNAVLDWSELNGTSVVDGKKPEESPVQHTHFVPAPPTQPTQEEKEMFFADICSDTTGQDNEPSIEHLKSGAPAGSIDPREKLPMTLLGQEVKNFDDVTRVMQEAKAAKAIKADPCEECPDAEKRCVVCELPEAVVKLEDLKVSAAQAFTDFGKASDALVKTRSITRLLDITELQPRSEWEASRKMLVSAALINRIMAKSPIPPEWLEEYNERVKA